MTVNELKERAGSFTLEDLAQIRTAAHAYAVWHGYEEGAADYTTWYVESNTADENAGWDNLPEHSKTFAAWMVL